MKYIEQTIKGSVWALDLSIIYLSFYFAFEHFTGEFLYQISSRVAETSCLPVLKCPICVPQESILTGPKLTVLSFVDSVVVMLSCSLSLYNYYIYTQKDARFDTFLSATLPVFLSQT